MRQQWCLLLILLWFVCLIGCSATSGSRLPHATEKIVNKANGQGFIQQQHPTHTFVLTSLEHLTNTNEKNIHVYIEGDGNSWKSRYRISDNPTPKQPLALKLALLDPHPQVVYLARPCQYTSLSADPICSNKFWSSHRYAPEVIEATNDMLNHIKQKTKNTNFTLIGFSGGASVALLVAAKRQDVSRLITVAGDLNHEILNEHHGTTPLHGSLNPKDVISQIRHIPQSHWCGSKDTVVPCWTVEEYIKATNNPTLIQMHTLKGATHHKGWEKQWISILNT